MALRISASESAPLSQEELPEKTVKESVRFMNAEVRIKQAARCVVLSCWTIVFLSLSLVAQTPQLVITKHGPVVQQAAGPDPGLQTIFSNLGSKNDAYDDGVAYQISGPENPLWGKSFLAMPFTPKKDCTLKEVLI